MRGSFFWRRIVAWASLCIAVGSASAATYDFESVSGTLAGQDGWVAPFGTGGPSFITIGAGVNSTRVLTIGPDDFQEVMRPNGGAFGYAFTGTETAALIQFDFSWNRPDDGFGIRLGVGRDVNGDSYVSPNEGIGLRYSGGQFQVETGGNGFAGIAFRTAVNAGDVGDWFRLRLLADFPAHTATMSYENLTRGDTSFTALSTVNLQYALNLPGSQNPSDWIAVDLSVNRTVQIDNLVVSGAVPEPGMLGALALVSLFVGRRGKR